MTIVDNISYIIVNENLRSIRTSNDTITQSNYL